MVPRPLVLPAGIMPWSYCYRLPVSVILKKANESLTLSWTTSFLVTESVPGQTDASPGADLQRHQPRCSQHHDYPCLL